MKIFAITRNYGDFLPSSPFGEGPRPVWYEIPDSSILRSGQPFFLPDFSTEFRAFPSLAIRIGRLGKGIAEKFAARYVADSGIACAVVATPLLAELRRDGLPWAAATAFDKCCWLGKFTPGLTKDSEYRICSGDNAMTYRTANLRCSPEAMISALSREITLKEGDVILVALHPEGMILSYPASFTINDSDAESLLLDIHLR